MKPKYAVLVIGFITSVITGVLFSPTAKAATDYDTVVQNTNTLSVISPDGTYNYSVASDAGDNSWDNLIPDLCGSSAVTDDFSFALSGGFVSVLQLVLGDQHLVLITWDSSHSSDGWYFDTTTSMRIEETTGQALLAVGDDDVMWASCSADPLSLQPFAPNFSVFDVYFYQNNYPVEYPSGYEGEDVSSIPGVGDITRPQIGYAVDESYLLRAQYLRNLDNAGVIDTIHNTNYEWKYTVYESGFDYVKGDQLDTKTLNGLAPYEYQLPSAGYYVFTVDLSITPPAAPRTDIKGVTFNINADGTFKVASNVNLTCDDNGVCDDAASNCDYYSDIFQKTVCIVQKQLSVGVINPSINSFKAIVSSVIVSDTPSCSIPLPDVSISGKTLPFSELGPSACAQAANFRAVFPVSVVLINFAFAFLILISVVGIVNKITDNNRHNLVEGI